MDVTASSPVWPRRAVYDDVSDHDEVCTVWTGAEVIDLVGGVLDVSSCASGSLDLDMLFIAGRPATDEIERFAERADVGPVVLQLHVLDGELDRPLFDSLGEVWIVRAACAAPAAYRRERRSGKAGGAAEVWTPYVRARNAA